MNSYEEIKQKIEGKKKKSSFWFFLELVFVTLALILSFLIYAQKDEDGKFLQKYFNLNVSFKDFNNKVGLALTSMLANFNIFIKQDDGTKKVSASIQYQKQGNNYYTYESQEIPMLFYGKILSIEEEKMQYIISVYYSNGINACYYNVINNHVKKGDLLNKGDSLGTYEDNFKVIFAKNNQIISYEEALLS